MITFQTFASSSSGNAALLAAGDTRLLVDMGVSCRRLCQALSDRDLTAGDLTAVVVTHEHTDHLLGIVWLIRVIATRMKNNQYEGDLNIYCHQDLPETITTICRLTVQGKFFKLIGDRIHLIPVHDGQT